MSPPIFHRLLVANRGEVAVRIARACDALGITPVFAVSRGRPRRAVHPRSRGRGARPGPRRAVVPRRAPRGAGRGADPLHGAASRLGLPVGEPAARDPVRAARRDLRRSAAPGDGADGRQEPRQARDARRGPRGDPRQRRAAAVGRRGARVRRRGRLSGLAQGRERRRRPRHAHRARARRGRGRVHRGPGRGPRRVRRRARVPRAADRGRPPRRDPGVRRSLRQRDPRRRARLHRAAQPPEADRGEPVAGAPRRRARQTLATAVAATKRHRLRRRRHRSRCCSRAGSPGGRCCGSWR
jgi:hypothetical protein